jgi:hypothetical protein
MTILGKIDLATSDMFAQEVSSEGHSACASVYGLEHPALNVHSPNHHNYDRQEPHDTCEISAIYMQRHSYMKDTSLGCWFDRAHELKDNDLRNCTTALEAKRLIVRKHYNRLSLLVLQRYNAGIGKGERQE